MSDGGATGGCGPSPTSSAPEAGQPDRTGRLPVRSGRFREIVLVFLALLVAGIAMNLVIIPRVYVAAPADGVVYLDAFERAYAGRITVQGDQVSPAVIDRVACSNRIPDPLIVKATDWECGEPREPGFQASTAWIHPPTYFFVDAMLARGVTAVLPTTDPVDAARLLGALWFAAGGTLLVILGGLWGARTWPSTIVILAFLPTPLFTAIFSYLTPDRAVLLVGAGVLIAVTWCLRGRLAPPWLAVAGIAAGGLFKQTFVLAALTGALLIATVWLLGKRGATDRIPTRRAGAAIAWLMGGTAVGLVGWQLLKTTWGQVAQSRSEPDFFTLEPGVGSLIRLMFHGTTGIPGGDTTIDIQPSAMLGIAALLALLSAGAAFGALMYGSMRDRVWPMALTGVLAIGLGGVVIGVLGSVSSGNWLPPSPRYVMPAFAAYVVPLLVLAQGRFLKGLLGAVAVIGALSWLVTPLW